MDFLANSQVFTYSMEGNIDLFLEGNFHHFKGSQPAACPRNSGMLASLIVSFRFLTRYINTPTRVIPLVHYEWSC